MHDALTTLENCALNEPCSYFMNKCSSFSFSSKFVMILTIWTRRFILRLEHKKSLFDILISLILIIKRTFSYVSILIYSDRLPFSHSTADAVLEAFIIVNVVKGTV